MIIYPKDPVFLVSDILEINLTFNFFTQEVTLSNHIFASLDCNLDIVLHVF